MQMCPGGCPLTAAVAGAQRRIGSARHTGYVVMTICRALYSLATGEQTTKENAAAWAAARYPEWSSFISEAHQRYRADVRDSHQALISFTDRAVAQADDLIR